MKRSYVLVISCACALALSLFGLSGCGGDAQSSKSSASSTSSAAASPSSTTDSSSTGSESISTEEMRTAFEQMLMTMSEFYHGTTPAGEELYYAGGADGANAVFALVVPETAESIFLYGPATVGEDDNKLTVTDETTGAALSFAVTPNDDGTITFSMGEEYGGATMIKCKSSEIVDKLMEYVANAPTQEPTENSQSEDTAAQQE